jgi:anti-anti-sigma factor
MEEMRRSVTDTESSSLPAFSGGIPGEATRERAQTLHVSQETLERAPMQTGPYSRHLGGAEVQPQPPPLSIEVSHPSPDVRVVTPVGDADLCTVPGLQQALDEVTGSGCSPVIVDLDRLTFMDASLLGVLVEVRTRLSATGGTLHVRCSTAHGRRILALTGLDYMLDQRS